MGNHQNLGDDAWRFNRIYGDNTATVNSFAGFRSVNIEAAPSAEGPVSCERCSKRYGDR